MTRILTGSVLLAALLLSGCFEGSNTSCTSDCFSLNFKEGTDDAQVNAMAKEACEKMGKSKPQIAERTKTAAAGQCT